MTTQEDFYEATFAASNAIIHLATILYAHKLTFAEAEEGKAALLDIIGELRITIEESEFATEHAEKHVEYLSKLANSLKW